MVTADYFYPNVKSAGISNVTNGNNQRKWKPLLGGLRGMHLLFAGAIVMCKQLKGMKDSLMK